MPSTDQTQPLKIRGVRVFLPDERRCADPDRPVRIEIAGVAYADLNAGEAGRIAAALVALAGEPQASATVHAAGYAEAVARLRDDARYLTWWTSDGVTPDGPVRQHLADYLETVGPDPSTV